MMSRVYKCVLIQEEMHRWYANCEMRTVMLSDSSGGGGHDPFWFAGGKSIPNQST